MTKLLDSRGWHALPLLLAVFAGLASALGPWPATAAEVEQACAEADKHSGEIARVVAAAQAFALTLDDRQRAALNHPFEKKYAIRWSNFPAGLVPRNGVPFGDLDDAQAAAATRLIEAAAGACGATLFAENRRADIIGQTRVRLVDPRSHFVSYNGEPSTTKPWMLMISGHHLDFNFVFNGGKPGATPLFAGTDPGHFTTADGRQHEPMARPGNAMVNLARAVARYPEARLPGVFTDLVRSVVSFGDPLGGKGPPPPPRTGAPGAPIMGKPDDDSKFGIDAHFPQSFPEGTTGRGVSYARLDATGQALVRRAIATYAGLAGRALSEPLLQTYLRPEALATTYVAWSGDPKLKVANSYLRIDGPRLWIELSVQESLYDKSETHYHSLWRDKESDYGGRFRL